MPGVDYKQFSSNKQLSVLQTVKILNVYKVFPNFLRNCNKHNSYFENSLKTKVLKVEMKAIRQKFSFLVQHMNVMYYFAYNRVRAATS